MPTSREQRRKLWLAWAGLTIAGYVAATLVTISLTFLGFVFPLPATGDMLAMSSNPTPIIIVCALALLLGHCALAAIQRLAWKRHIPLAWLAAWAFGGLAAVAITAASYATIPEAIPEMSDVPLAAAPIIGGSFAAGAVAGAAQWLVLRRKFTKSSWWVLAAALAWAAGNTPYVVTLCAIVALGDRAPILVPAIMVSLAPLFIVGVPVVLLLPGALMGACTGFVLVRLVPRRTASASGFSGSDATDN